MAEIDEKSEASITISQGQDSHPSYGFSSLVKAMQRGNSNSFRKKVGSMVSTVFCKHSNFTVTKLNNITVEGSESGRKRVDESSGEGKAEGGSGEGIGRSVSEMMGGRSKKGQVWRKRILRGRKCRPLNGSGVIHYDENGFPSSHHLS
ncbi:hypothetical protein V6N13_114191 [Hibiscus sabdariffa]|uniref:Uncharacterized protein n=1 Tax=Hibiscus sabdariffa TaxID=183260 RepID=A0ABR2U1S4_9ROSI